MGSWSLVTGWLPWTVTVTGAVALTALLATRRRTFWTRSVPGAVGTVVGLVLLVEILVDRVWQPFPDRLSVNNLGWSGIGLLAVGLAWARFRQVRQPVRDRLPVNNLVCSGIGLLAIGAPRARFRQRRWWARIAAAAAAGAVLAASTIQINMYWSLFPTVHAVADALRTAPSGIPPDATATRTVTTVPPGKTLVDVWRPPADMPRSGSVSQVPIPGTASRFAARSAYLYLPPAYRVSPRPLLPVLVMLSGQPGSPQDWFSVLGLADAADAFARAHRGLAPVVVVPDDLGSVFANPLCVDSPLGEVETYLSTDVPAWIRANLQVAADREDWFIGGLSHGGTCSLQLAVRAPHVYGGFVDISGQREPTLGSRTRTVQRVFGGSTAAFARINPLDILAHTRYPHTAGFLVVGAADQTYLPQQRQVRDACTAAGMDITWLELPGGHTGAVWRAGLVRALPWLGARARLVNPEQVPAGAPERMVRVLG
jgi:enterochelin esterase-like enzyme